MKLVVPIKQLLELRLLYNLELFRNINLKLKYNLPSNLITFKI